jgi:hypothetical protein
VVIINVIHLNFGYKRLTEVNKEKENLKRFYLNNLIIKFDLIWNLKSNPEILIKVISWNEYVCILNNVSLNRK